MRTRPGRKRRDGGRHAVIAQVVEENPAGAFVLRHVEDEAVRIIMCDDGADVGIERRATCQGP